MFRDEIWISERRNVFKKRVRPHLTHCLKIKHANKLEPFFLGDIRPERYCDGDPLFETWLYDRMIRGDIGISGVAFQLMPFSSLEERLEYFSNDVIGGLKSYGSAHFWPSVSPGSDNVMLGWSVDEEDKWFERLYGDLLSENPSFHFWENSERWTIDICSMWMDSLGVYFSEDALRASGHPRLIRDGAFSNRRVDLFFSFLGHLRGAVFLLRRPRREDYLVDDDVLVDRMICCDWRLQAQLRRLCIFCIDYEGGFRDMTSYVYKDYRPYFENICNIDAKKDVLLKIRREFSSNPLLAPLYDAAIRAKDWGELHRMWKFPDDDS